MLVGLASETRQLRQMDRSKRRSKARGPGREGSRQRVFVVAIGSVLAIGLFAAGELKGWQFLPRGFGAKAAPVPSADEVYTGSVLYVPDEGTICRQLLFDNRTGRMQDNGLVDCEQAYYRGTGDTAMQWSNARAVVISQSFRGH
jgi:hypothetical protein